MTLHAGSRLRPVALAAGVTDGAAAARSSIPLPAAGSEAIDWELMLCTHVLGLRSLHWGVWEDDDPLTLDGLRVAQARYTDRLLAAVPAGVRTVLDVGCGMGDNAAALADAGYRVTSIAPIANYVEHLDTLRARGVTFVQTTIERFRANAPFDLVLMSESCGYFSCETAFERSWDALRPGGHLLVCNMFRSTKVALRVGTHVLGDFLAQGRRSGFRLVADEDITRATLPTLRLATSFWDDYCLPSIGLGAFYLRSASWKTRLVHRLACLLCATEVSRIAAKLRLYREQLNPELVGRHASYRLMVFRKDAALRAVGHPVDG